MIFSKTILLRKTASLRVVEVKLSFIITILLSCDPVENCVDSEQIILKFSTKIGDVFFLFKMSKEPVEKEELGIPTRDQTPDARQIMQLSEGASKSCFAALLGTRNDKDPFLVLQMEVIANHGCALPNKVYRPGLSQSIDERKRPFWYLVQLGVTEGEASSSEFVAVF